MSKRTVANQKKLAVLALIEEKKGILFGNFKNVNAKEKQAAWQSVLDKAKALELTTADRSWTFARDCLFGVWKSRTLSKRDNARKTGTEGGKDNKLDEIDLAILKILDAEGAAVTGLEMPESDVGTGDGLLFLPLDERDVVEQEPRASSEITAPTSKKRKKENSQSQYQTLKEELLRIEIYRRRLHALKLERELGIDVSEYTNPLFQ